MTLAGTVPTAVLLLASATTSPPLGAGPLRVMVPWGVFPQVTFAGLRLMSDTVTAGERVHGQRGRPVHAARGRRDGRRHGRRYRRGRDPEAGAGRAGGHRDAGRYGDRGRVVGERDDQPARGRGGVRVTVPVAELPPVTLAGLMLRVDRVGAVVGFTVSMAVCVTPPNVALRPATIWADTS